MRVNTTNLVGFFTYANIVEMIHDEEDDQGERLINEGMRKLLGMEGLFNMLTFNRIQDVEEEQPFSVRHDLRVSCNLSPSQISSI
jgi:hypothetical protein